jgi:hypothetical protein
VAGSELDWRKRVFTVNPVVIAGHNPGVLLVGAFRDLHQPAPLGLDPLGVTIDRSPAPA